ncbi:hypothetical protein EIN_086750 [Entamoeba invadens IP1]|uniref:hypothetical protein n=1 Tax=Entamoeba invadens IP1 TaxID=370355 RepID=UPI0002C3D326|nr:hypothetical protein EIN_086750 [Entamoeba invadens IP1]ELP85393.1 hypothetical protein EIN_086750 [Entamoeba invadens IP1]|eukprot:XP_004184739.1 hypothetical protein EIN_086750 [Entamoeba invadens IP1]
MKILITICLIALVKSSSNTRCDKAEYVDLISQNAFSVTDKTTHIKPSKYDYSGTEISGAGRWYKIRTNGVGDILEIDTCLSGHTNFDTKIVVMSKCENGVGLGLLTINDDSYNQCGSSARLLFNDMKRDEFYVMVTGSAPSDVGVFGLQITRYPPLVNQKCENAIQVAAFPSYREGTTTAIAPNYNDLSGLFYYFQGNGKKLKITTCHRGTNVDTLITVFESCNNHDRIASKDGYCTDGNMGSQTTLDTENNRIYYVHVASSPRKRGTFIVAFEGDDEVNVHCKMATAMRQFPYVHTSTVNPSIMTKNCQSEDQGGNWYSILGDNNYYSFHTCSSSAIGETTLHLFNECGDDMRECSTETEKCLENGKIQKYLEKDKTYYLKVLCRKSSERCVVTLTVERIGNIMMRNSTCQNPHIFTFKSENDVFYDTFDMEKTDVTEPICGMFRKRHGSWYGVRNLLNTPFPIFVQTVALKQNRKNYNVNIEFFRNCFEKCEEQQLNEFHVTVNPNDFILIFVSGNTGGDVGVFIRKELRTQHDACKLATEMNAPFSLVEYKSNHGRKTTNVCHLNNKGNDNKTSTGVYYYFQSPVTDVFVVETCGIETHFDTYLEVFQGCSEGVCVMGNDDSPECGSVASYVKFDAQEGAEYYIYISESEKAIDTEGTFRLNVYTLTPPIHSKCDKAELLTPGLRQHALTKYAFSTISGCGMKTLDTIKDKSLLEEMKKKYSEKLLGVWYQYTAPVNGKIHINTCNAATSVKSRIEVYKSCSVYEVSIGDKCINESSVVTNPCSSRGTHVSADMLKSETLLFFVGGETSRDVGFVAVDSYFETISPEYTQVKYEPTVGLKRRKEKRTPWMLWIFWFCVYAGLCAVIFFALKLFNKRDHTHDGYHEL